MAKRYVVVIVTALENFFHSLLVLGWPSLVYVFKDVGYYSDLCPVELSGNTSTNLSSTTATSTTSSQITSPTMEITTTSRQITSSTTETSSTSSQITCDEQDASLLLIYTVVTSLVPISMIFGGFLFQKGGTLITRLIISFSLMFAYLCIAASSPATPYLLYPGTTIMGIAGVLFLIASLEVGNLFPANKSLVIGVMAGCADASPFMLLLVKIAYDYGVPVQVSFYVLAASTSMFMVNTILLPRTHIPWPLPENFRLGWCWSSPTKEDAHIDDELTAGKENCDEPSTIVICVNNMDTDGVKEGISMETEVHNKLGNENHQENLQNGCVYENSGFDGEQLTEDIQENVEKANASDEVTNKQIATQESFQNSYDSYLAVLDKLAEDRRLEDFPTFGVVLKSPMFILMTIWTVTCQGFVLFVIGIANSWLTWLAEGDLGIVSYYTNIYSIINVGVLFGTPLVGSFIDRNRRGLRNINSTNVEACKRGPYTDLKESWLPVCLSCVTTVFTAGLMLIPLLLVQYVTFAMFVVVRSVFFATSSTIVSIAFPTHFYPPIFGLLNAISGIFSFVQYPLFIFIQDVLHNDPRWVIAGFLVANAVMLVYPAYIYFYARKCEQRLKNKIKTKTETNQVT